MLRTVAKRYSLPVGSFWGGEWRYAGRRSWQGRRLCNTHIGTILFIPLSPAQYNLEGDWGEVGAELILRQCPICLQDSIIGHGRRRRQAHDEYHDWIAIRRGRCNRCGKTFTFLPPFSAVRKQNPVSRRINDLQGSINVARDWVNR